MIKKFLLIILPVIASFGCDAQNYEPLELARKIFVTGHFNSFGKYTKGEYRANKGRPNLNDFKPDIKKTFLLLEQKEDKAVVAMTVSDSLNEGLDMYLHFEKDSIWKMTAVRALALTGMIESERNELKKLSQQQVDTILAKAKQNPDAPHLFASKDEYNFELGNTNLWIGFDDSLISHFQRNKIAFERLKDSALIFIQKDQDVKQLKNSYRKLFITAITPNDDGFTNSLNFVIGGLTDNVVGYVYIKDEKDVPDMDPDSIIMLRSIGNGWYIYKTT